MCCLTKSGLLTCLSSEAEVPPSEFIGIWQGTKVDAENRLGFVHFKVWPDGVIDFESFNMNMNRVPMRGWSSGSITGSACLGHSCTFQLQLIDDATCKLNDVSLTKIDDMNELGLKFDRDETEMTRLLEYYNKILLVEAFMEKYEPFMVKGLVTRSSLKCKGVCTCNCMPVRRYYKQVMITEQAFGEMLDDADLMVENNREHAAKYGIKKTTEISVLIATGRHLQLVRGELMKVFAEAAGAKLVDGMLSKSAFVKAIILMDDDKEDPGEIALSQLMNFYLKSVLTDAFFSKYESQCETTKTGETLVTNKAFGQLLQDADTFVDDNSDSCAEFGIKKSKSISWKIRLGRNLGLVRGEIMKKFAQASGKPLVDGGLTREAFFASLMNMK